MVQEIIYTSAEKGLKQGSRGFCTVISTAGMAINLAERLESMSGYRQAFPVGDPRAPQNPICYSHVTTRLAGKTLHVISRIADAGQDYTGRSNKLAHHVALENVSTLSGGPARVLCHPGVVVDRWNGEVKTVPSRELPAVVAPKDVTLSVWKGITGDHGWAGVVAEQLTSSPAPVNIIFSIGMNTIGMVTEVMDLLPPNQRWNVTFSTYFTRLLAGTECQLRFVLDDTPEATGLRNDAKARVIDLTNPLPEAKGGSLVTMARGGTIRPDVPTAESTNAFSDLQAAARTRSTAVTVGASSPSAASPKPTTTTPANNLARPPLPLPTGATEPRNRKGLWIVIALVLVVVSSVATAIFLTRETGPDKFGDLLARKKNTEPAKPDAELERLKRESAEREAAEKKQREEQLARENQEKAALAEQEAIAKGKADEEARLKAKAELERKMAEEERVKVLREEGAFAFVKASVAAKDGKWHDERGQWLFELPKPVPNAKSSPLTLRVFSGKVTLRLWKEAEPLFAGNDYNLELQPDDLQPLRWKLQSGTGASRQTLGAYYITEKSSGPESPVKLVQLQFEWLEDVKREHLAGEFSKWWPLEVSIEDADRKQTAVFLQRRAFTPNPAPSIADFLTKELSFPVGAELTSLGDSAALNMQFRMQFTESGGQPQSIEVALKNKEPLEDPAMVTNADETALTSVAGRVFFPLQRPVQFVDAPPDLDGMPHGIASLLVRPKFGENALKINIISQIYVRLPPPAHITDLPSIELLTLLESLGKCNTGLEFVRTLCESSFNPKLGENLKRSLEEEAKAYFSEPDRWYTQSLKALRPLTGWRMKYFQLKENAFRHLQFGENLARQNGTDLTAANREKLLQFRPVLEDTGKTLKGVFDDYMVAYSGINEQVGAVLEALNTGKVEFLLYSELASPGMESGDAVTIYYYDTNPPRSESPM